MIDKAYFITFRHLSALLIAASAACITAAHLQTRLQAIAAEVDAASAPAPIGFADIVERIKPAVVGVRVKVEISKRSDSQRKKPFPHEGPFDQLFRQFGIPIPDTPAPRSATALGSGFFISKDGYIVTNNHVVAKGGRIEVIADSGMTYEASLVGTDPETDLALIKVSAAVDSAYVRFAESDLRIGDWVLAMGTHSAWVAR
jgi:serine protease Do